MWSWKLLYILACMNNGEKKDKFFQMKKSSMIYQKKQLNENSSIHSVPLVAH